MNCSTLSEMPVVVAVLVPASVVQQMVSRGRQFSISPARVLSLFSSPLLLCFASIGCVGGVCGGVVTLRAQIFEGGEERSVAY